jgi:hypothetical protein
MPLNDSIAIANTMDRIRSEIRGRSGASSVEP